MMRIGVIGNESRDQDFEVARSLVAWLEDQGVETLLNSRLASTLGRREPPVSEWDQHTVEFALVLGGDGTLLRAAIQTEGLGIPLLGINLGRLGFLTEIEVSDMFAVLPSFLEGKFVRDDRHFMSASVVRDGIIIDEYLALNDVVVGKGLSSRMVDLRTWVDQALMASYRADGMILSTATGSTAYSLSAGGPVVHPALEVLIVTPVCPHSFHARPVVLSPRQVVRIEVDPRNEITPVMTVDGRKSRDLRPGEMVVAGLSESTVTLLRCPEWNFYEVLRRKFSATDDHMSW